MSERDKKIERETVKNERHYIFIYSHIYTERERPRLRESVSKRLRESKCWWEVPFGHSSARMLRRISSN